MEEIILREREYREKLANITNEIQLPAFILKPIIKEMYEQLNMIEEQQYNEALNIMKQKEAEQEKNEQKVTKKEKVREAKE